jgi:hypothetical protein
MDACWSVSTSFPLPAQGEDPALEDDALAVTVQSQRDEAMAYNYGMPMPNAVREGDRGADSAAAAADHEGEGEGGNAGSTAVVTQSSADAALLARLFGAE